MSYLSQITSPTLLLNEKICRDNIQRMSQKAKKHNMALVPHFKTAQSREVGEWAKEYGINQITVSSIKMAEYFCPQNWDNIHIAFPFNPLEIKKLNQLASKHSISVQLVNHPVAQKLVKELQYPIGFFIEIDAGYGRTGVNVSDFGLIEALLLEANKSENLNFKGFYLHPGHTYYMDNKEKIYDESRAALRMLKDKYRSEFPNLVTRIGDTPGCAVIDDFGDIDEMGPGNFVFFDMMQVNLASCTKANVAVALAVPIVDIQAERSEILIHGGGVHLAKDVLLEADGSKNFGEVVYLTNTGWEIPAERSFLKSISQEHGIIKASEELLKRVQVGDVIGILPVHSCMTADCMESYITLEGKVVDHAEGS